MSTQGISKADKRMTQLSARKEWFDVSLMEIQRLSKELATLSQWLYEERGIKSGWNMEPGGRSSDTTDRTGNAAVANLAKSPTRAQGEKAITDALYQLRRAQAALELSVEGSI